MKGKLYLLTRDDLRRSSASAQLVHGMASFAMEHRDVFESWNGGSNIVVCLSVKDAKTLKDVLDVAKAEGIPCSYFEEPDMDEEITCVVLGPSTVSQKLCSRFRLSR